MQKAQHKLNNYQSESFIRSGTPVDSCALAALERECFSSPWSEESFTESVGGGTTSVLCYIKNGIIIGYIGVQHTQDTGFITNICVTESERGQGIGKVLIEALIEQSRGRGQKEITLEVRKSNGTAIRLYERAGFEGIGERPGFYDNPKENAVIMTKAL